MAQLNVNVTPDFERALKRLMKARGLKTKSDAVRLAVLETAERATLAAKKVDWSALRGLALTFGEANPNPKFKSEDDLWEKG